jgi:MFS family permease
VRANDLTERRHLSELAGLIAADGISRFGSVMTVTAIPWFVLVTTGSAAQTGITVFASAMGIVLALLFGGAIVDRLSFRRASIAADLMAGCLVALIPTLYLTVGLPFWLLLLLVFAGTLIDTPAQVARYSALPDISQRAQVRFERANAIFDAVLTSCSLVGPALAGVLIAVVGASNVLWIDSATFVLSALVVATMVTSRPDTAEDRPPSSGYLKQIGAAAHFVLGDTVLRPLIVVLAVMNIAIGPIEAVVVPVVANDIYHSSYALGIMSSAIALGALGGNAIYGAVGHRLSRRAVFGLGFLVVPLAYGVLALSPVLIVAVVIFAVFGLGGSLTNLLEYTIYFERLPREMRARGLGMTGVFSWGTVPVGRILAGAGIAAVGLSATLGTASLVFLPLPLLLLSGRKALPLNLAAAEPEQ